MFVQKSNQTLLTPNLLSIVEYGTCSMAETLKAWRRRAVYHVFFIERRQRGMLPVHSTVADTQENHS